MTDYIWKQTEIAPPSASAIVPAERGREADRLCENCARVLIGTWPADDLRRAFVAGAAWWEFHQKRQTLFPEERDDAEAEAEKRYGALASSPVQPEPSSVARGADDLVSQVEAQQQEIGRQLEMLRQAVALIDKWGAETEGRSDAAAVAISDCADQLAEALAPTDAGSVRTMP